MEASLFGRSALKDPNFVFDLRKGRCPNLRTIQRVRAFMTGYAARPVRAASHAIPPVGSGDIAMGEGEATSISFQFGSVGRSPSRLTEDRSGSRGCSAEFRAAAPIAFFGRG
jgi:hypothetical protein